MTPLFKYYGPAIFWGVFILVLCTMRFGSIGKSHLFFPGFDKLVHCGLFIVLAVFYSTGYLKRRKIYILNASTITRHIALLLVYGTVIEVLQIYVFTWRSGEWADLFADATGAVLGLFAVYITAYNLYRYEES